MPISDKEARRVPTYRAPQPVPVNKIRAIVANALDKALSESRKREPQLGVPIEVVGNGKNRQPIFKSELGEQQRRRMTYGMPRPRSSN